MSEQPLKEEAKNWHRHFGAEANNSAWTLAEKTELTESGKSEMLDAAHAAAYHWKKIGTDSQKAHADMLLGHVHARLGNGPFALSFARCAFDFITTRKDSALWEIAFAHAILAGAGAALGDRDLHGKHYREARSLREKLEGQDRDLFIATFESVPKPD